MASMMRAGNTDALPTQRDFAARAPGGLTAFRARVDIALAGASPYDPDRPYDPTRAAHAMPLSMLIETEIIPRLVVAHTSGTMAPPLAAVPPAAMPAATGQPSGIDEADVAAIVPLALNIEADLLLGHVEAILARGVTVDAVLVDLLAPAARLLGEYWEDDRCDFIDVTMGLWRLQEVVHELATRVPADRPLAPGGSRALFASMPGDQHSFGAVVIDELFRREGWLTERMSEAETADLLHRAAGDWFDMIGLTVSCDCHIAALGPLIAALRNVSRNPRVSILVGGRVFGADPELAARIGADGTARDAKLALELADSLVRKRDGRAGDGRTRERESATRS